MVNSTILGFTRYVYLFFRLRLLKRPLIVDWINGLRYKLLLGDSCFTGNYYFGLVDYWESMFLINFLGKNDVFFDIGANQGHYSLLATGICRSSVHAFEPQPSTSERLMENIKLNNLESMVEVHRIALGNENKNIKMTSTLGSMNRVLDDTVSGQSISVQMKCLDDLNLPTPSMIKMDVEGYEFDVIKGARNVLKSDVCQALLVELNQSSENYGYTDHRIISLLGEFGFHPYQYFPEKGTIMKLEGVNKNSYNTLFLKNTDRVQRMLSSNKKSLAVQ